MSALQTGTNICGRQFRAMETKPHLPGYVPCTVPRVRHSKDQHSHAQCGTDIASWASATGKEGTAQPLPSKGQSLLGIAVTKYPWTTALEQGQEINWCGKQGIWWFFDENANTVHGMAEFGAPDRAAFSIPPFSTGKMARGAPGALLNIFPSAVKAQTSTLSCLFWTAMGYTGREGRTR